MINKSAKSSLFTKISFYGGRFRTSKMQFKMYFILFLGWPNRLFLMDHFLGSPDEVLFFSPQKPVTSGKKLRPVQRRLWKISKNSVIGSFYGISRSAIARTRLVFRVSSTVLVLSEVRKKLPWKNWLHYVHSRDRNIDDNLLSLIKNTFLRH